MNKEKIIKNSRHKLYKNNVLRERFTPSSIIIFLVLLLYSLFLIALLFWGVLTSLKSKQEFRTNVFGFPNVVQLSNYIFAFKNFFVTIESGATTRRVLLMEMLGNSLLYSLGCAFASTFISCTVAYAVARFKFVFSKIIYSIVIVTMVLPIVGSLPSEIQMAQTLGLYDKIWGLWIMKANFLGMYFLVFHAAFRVIPKDYTEAAQIDGASNLRIFIQIMMPLVKSAFLTIFLLNFIGFWNDYQTPLMFMPNYPTIAYGLYLFSFSTINVASSVPMKITGCMVMLIPILTLFIIFNNKLIGNVSIGGIKE